jgi:hypothetical protein
VPKQLLVSCLPLDPGHVTAPFLAAQASHPEAPPSHRPSEAHE